MRIKGKFFAVACAVILALSVFAGCTTDDGGDETPELSAGVITYENATCESIINKADSGTVATAVASNGAPVSYSLDESEAAKIGNTFDGKLSVDSQGVIKGAAAKLAKIKVKITASAEKCESVTAEITISVVNPYLDFTGRALADARQGLPYAASVAYVLNEDVEDLSYRKIGDLPAGLTFDAETGIITGTPTEVGPGKPFTIQASAKGFSQTRADFTIDVVINHVSSAKSKIINFGAADGAKTLADAYVETTYVNQSGVAGNAAALNNNAVTYTLADGSAPLPAGLTLYPNGAILGRANDRAEATFSVTATAAECDPVTKEFKLAVKPQRIKYQPISGVITRGEAADVDLAKADAGEGVTITYTMTEADAKALKDEYGLEVTAQGRLIGTPKKSIKQMSFDVTAEAQDFSPTKVTMWFRINEPLQAPANGRFEAEYIELTGKNGTGYSSSPAAEGMIDKFNGTSNGHFINYMFNDSITLEFVIYAESAASNVPLWFALGSEFGSAKFDPSSLAFAHYEGKDLTGKKNDISYSPITVEGSKDGYTTFNEYRVGSVNLVEGWNVIQLAIKTNTLRDGLIGGPGVDYMRLETTVPLKWQPLVFNISG